jgi:hypothetical protein
MSKAVNLADLLFARRAGGEVYRALYGDPVPPTAMSRIHPR